MKTAYITYQHPQNTHGETSEIFMQTHITPSENTKNSEFPGN
jgi:hypothetical protein